MLADNPLNVAPFPPPVITNWSVVRGSIVPSSYNNVYLSSSNGAYTKSVPLRVGKSNVPNEFIVLPLSSSLTNISERVRSTDSIFLSGISANKNPLCELLMIGDTTLKPDTLVALEGIEPVHTLDTFATASTSILVPNGDTVLTLLSTVPVTPDRLYWIISPVCIPTVHEFEDDDTVDLLPAAAVKLNDCPPNTILGSKIVSPLNVWTPTSCLIEWISFTPNSVTFVIILPLSIPSTVIASSWINWPAVWCSDNIFPVWDLKNPLAPDLLPSINAGADNDNVLFKVISVSVWISNKNKSKLDATFEYPPAESLKSYTLALPIDWPAGSSLSVDNLSLLRSTYPVVAIPTLAPPYTLLSLIRFPAWKGIVEDSTNSVSLGLLESTNTDP